MPQRPEARTPTADAQQHGNRNQRKNLHQNPTGQNTAAPQSSAAQQKNQGPDDGGNGYFFADVNLFPDRDDLFYAILVNDPRSQAASSWIQRLILTAER